jgi:hypothetical protein
MRAAAASSLLLLSLALPLLATALLPAAPSGSSELELGAGDGLGERLFPKRQRLRMLGMEPAEPLRRCEGPDRPRCLELLLRGRRTPHRVQEDVLPERGGAQRRE